MDLMGSWLEQNFHSLLPVRRITQIWVVTFISMEFPRCLRSFLRRLLSRGNHVSMVAPPDCKISLASFVQYFNLKLIRSFIRIQSFYFVTLVLASKIEFTKLRRLPFVLRLTTLRPRDPKPTVTDRSFFALTESKREYCSSSFFLVERLAQVTPRQNALRTSTKFNIRSAFYFRSTAGYTLRIF